jgi:hypothetical protein
MPGKGEWRVVLMCEFIELFDTDLVAITAPTQT